MTPMIDMTFQLIAFFMFVLNFSKDVADERIKLPVADSAIPIQGPTEEPLWLNVNENGQLLAMGETWSVINEKPQVQAYLNREAAVAVQNMRYAAVADASVAEDLRQDKIWSTVVIRADGRTPSQAVKELIKTCKEMGFYKFRLRAVPREEP